MAKPVVSPRQLIDLTGRRFGCLIVSRRDGYFGSQIAWRCQCDCGNSLRVRGPCLRGGNTKSCGCLKHSRSVRFQDLAGQRFGRLVVTILAGVRRKRTFWWCKCDCGQIVEVHASALKTGKTKSCGCLRREGGNHRTHGGRSQPEYGVWSHMKGRCSNPNNRAYPDYGGRGVKVCARWLGADGFKNFLADLGPRPSPRHSIDRFPENDGDYEPGNCRWATRAQQNRNKRSNRMLTCCGETMCITDWSRRLGLIPSTIGDLLKRGWTLEEIVAHQ